MERVINVGIPHIGEQIFRSVPTSNLIRILVVSKTWKILAENILFERWREKISVACDSGNTAVMRILLERLENSEINVRGNYGHITYGEVPRIWKRTLLMLACQRGHINIIRLLMQFSKHKDIDLNAQDNNGYTALMIVCEAEEEHKHIVQLLLTNSRIDLNARDKYGRTAYDIACQQGHEKIAQKLKNRKLWNNCKKAVSWMWK